MQEYKPVNINKILEFKEHEILEININYPEFDFKTAKKINKFYAEIAGAFNKFCCGNLYKIAAVNFLMCERAEQTFEIFHADMNFEFKRESELINIELAVNINGKTARVSNIWNISGELIKPDKPKKKFSRRNDIKFTL